MLCSRVISLLTIHLSPSTPSVQPSPGSKTYQPEGRSVSSLLYLRDTLSSRKFLVDSGASLSVFSDPAASSNSGIGLPTIDGSSMNCSGSGIIPLKFRSKHYHWTLKLAPVSVPILGADLLPHHHLLVDVAGECLLKPTRMNAIIKSPTLTACFCQNRRLDPKNWPPLVRVRQYGKGGILSAILVPLDPLCFLTTLPSSCP